MEVSLTTPTIMRMTAEIRVKCDLIDQMIAEFIAARNTVEDTHFKYEAPREALLLFNLTIRNVEGVITLARNDLALLPAAEILVRAAVEPSIKAAWMMTPSDPFEREARWLAHLKSEKSYLEREIKELKQLGAEATASRVQKRLT
jgi:hypothetical protein